MSKARQLEFDLVIPEPPVPPESIALRTEAALLREDAGGGELLERARENELLATIWQDVCRQDFLSLTAQPTNELAVLRLLVGEANWKKTRRYWERHLKKNLTTVRKVIVVMLHLYSHEQKKNQKLQ